MANKKCSFCKLKKEITIVTPIYKFCSFKCASNKANEQTSKRIKREKAKVKQIQAKKFKIQKTKDKQRLKELMTRTQWHSKLQRLVNQFIVYARDKGEPCCTCNVLREKMDAGHYKAVGRGGADPRRFELTNIHAQCRYCNSFNGGKPNEYRVFLINKYGLTHVEWLECEVNHPTLREQFQSWQDIEKEINKYAKILRNHGIKPNLRN